MVLLLPCYFQCYIVSSAAKSSISESKDLLQIGDKGRGISLLVAHFLVEFSLWLNRKKILKYERLDLSGTICFVCSIYQIKESCAALCLDLF